MEEKKSKINLEILVGKQSLNDFKRIIFFNSKSYTELFVSLVWNQYSTTIWQLFQVRYQIREDAFHEMNDHEKHELKLQIFLK